MSRTVRDAKRHAYRPTGKGTKVALTFVLFHQRLSIGAKVGIEPLRQSTGQSVRTVAFSVSDLKSNGCGYFGTTVQATGYRRRWS